MGNKKVIGIDLGGTTAKFGIINQAGEIQTKWSIPTDISNEGSLIIPNLIESINSKLSSFSMKADDFIGIGMGDRKSVV